MPLQSIGLIIIDEAHEPSFKQEQSPRYSALRAASVLASLHKAKLIIEVDSSTHNESGIKEADDARQKELERWGLDGEWIIAVLKTSVFY
jgi:very-short-patch-repair endonuclease